MLGLSRGHQALRDDPKTGIDPLLDANRDLERSLQEETVRATLPVFFPEDEDRPFGGRTPDDWFTYSRWMTENGLLRQPPDPQAGVTNEFLPGEGPTPENCARRRGEPRPLLVGREQLAHLSSVARACGSPPVCSARRA
jgi:putative hydroxymethylpyrimidine transport system substrate-binding protein